MEAFIGTIMTWAPNFAPRGWAFCNGQLLPITQYQPAFALLGTMYGGDGRTTFGLPDLRGRAPIGAGRGPGLSDYPQGATGGVEHVTLNAAEMPSHSHNANSSGFAVSIPASSGGANTTTAGPGANLATAAAANRNDPVTNIYSSAAADTTVGGNLPVTGNVGIDVTGGSQGHENRMPYQALQYIICLEGIFPPRD